MGGWSVWRVCPVSSRYALCIAGHRPFADHVGRSRKEHCDVLCRYDSAQDSRQSRTTLTTSCSAQHRFHFGSNYRGSHLHGLAWLRRDFPRVVETCQIIENCPTSTRRTHRSSFTIRGSRPFPSQSLWTWSHGVVVGSRGRGRSSLPIERDKRSKDSRLCYGKSR